LGLTIKKSFQGYCRGIASTLWATIGIARLAFDEPPALFCPVVSVFAFIAVSTSLLVHARDLPAERYCFGGVPSVL
jgi:hypothetical protein